MGRVAETALTTMYRLRFSEAIAYQTLVVLLAAVYSPSRDRQESVLSLGMLTNVLRIQQGLNLHAQPPVNRSNYDKQPANGKTFLHSCQKLFIYRRKSTQNSRN